MIGARLAVLDHSPNLTVASAGYRERLCNDFATLDASIPVAADRGSLTLAEAKMINSG
jgi:hypothetical protein